MRRFDVVLLVILFLSLGLRFAYTYDLMAMESSLEDIARVEAAKLAQTGPHEEVTILGADITAAREYLIAGPAHGKITIYTAGSRRGIPADPLAFDFFYTQEGKHWKFEDSGACLHGESREKALAYVAEHPEVHKRL
jgi:hypothetical protein